MTSTTIRWWERDVAPGALLLGATALSFAVHNSGAGDAFRAFLKMEIGASGAAITPAHFAKDVLMAVFFLHVGLELKRERIEGPFRNAREAALPMLGALGGMLAPALLYLGVATAWHPDGDGSYARGWAIPTATDIAFAVGALSLLGARVPSGLRLFLLALAIADDLGAILVIAVFYTGAIEPAPMLGALALFVALMAANRASVTRLWPYMAMGVLLWFALAGAGVSPTLAGVLVAVAVPMRRADGTSPLIETEHALKTPVQCLVMPLFALSVAGVPVGADFAAALAHPVAVATIAGLVLGKPLGILLFVGAGVRMLGQRAPCSWPQLAGVGLLAGIGFTMSLFVGALAFPDHPELAAPVRFGVLGGSLLSVTVGLLWLNAVLQRGPAPDPRTPLSEEEELAEERGVLEDRD
jgi:NhaA family Na+:H+ antiporter